MVRFPWLFPRVLRRSGSLGSICATTKSVFQEGHVNVVQNWVYFFLAVSVLSLGVAWLFTREVIGSDTGTPAMQQIAEAIKQGAKAFLKRKYKTVAALLGLMLPTFAY